MTSPEDPGETGQGAGFQAAESFDQVVNVSGTEPVTAPDQSTDQVGVLPIEELELLSTEYLPAPEVM